MFGKTKNKAGNEDITEMMPEKQKGPMDKEKKKKIRRRVILGVVAVLAVAFFARNTLMAKNTAPGVATVAAERGDGEEI